MTTTHRILAAAALLGLATGASAQTRAVQRPCLNGPDAEAVALAIAPAALKAAGITCTGALPAGAFLRSPDPRFVARMQAASEEAWPRAREAVGRIAGPDVAPLLQSDALRPMVGALIAPLIVSELKPADCPKVDRILTLLSPLPARNIAALGITILQLSQDKAARGGNSLNLPLCRAER